MSYILDEILTSSSDSLTFDLPTRVPRANEWDAFKGQFVHYFIVTLFIITNTISSVSSPQEMSRGLEYLLHFCSLNILIYFHNILLINQRTASDKKNFFKIYLYLLLYNYQLPITCKKITYEF